MYCRKCGYHLAPRVQKCPKCGYMLERLSRQKTTKDSPPSDHSLLMPNEKSQSLPIWWLAIGSLFLLLVIAMIATRNNNDISSSSHTNNQRNNTNEQTTNNDKQFDEKTPKVIVGEERTSGIGDGAGVRVIGEFQEQTASPYHDFVNQGHNQDYITSFDMCYGVTLSMITGSSMGGGADVSNQEACSDGMKLAETHQGVRDAYDYYEQNHNVDGLDCSHYQKIEKRKQQLGMTDDDWDAAASEIYQAACLSAKSEILKSAT